MKLKKGYRTFKPILLAYQIENGVKRPEFKSLKRKKRKKKKSFSFQKTKKMKPNKT